MRRIVLRYSFCNRLRYSLFKRPRDYFLCGRHDADFPAEFFVERERFLCKVLLALSMSKGFGHSAILPEKEKTRRSQAGL